MRKTDKKEKNKKIKKEKTSKGKSRLIIYPCLIIIIAELVGMYFFHVAKENKITYMDTYNHIKNVNNEYYLAVGSSNFKYSHYNDPFIYEYEDELEEGNINKVYAEQAKLVKLDKELNIIFEKTFKTDYDSCFYDVEQVGDAIIAVGSYVYEKEQLSINTRDGLIVKYDLDGNMLWSKNYQILGDTKFKRVIKTDDGFIAIGQSIYENMEIGNHPTGGGIIVKYDLDGNIIWKNNFGGNKSGIFEDIVAVDDGYIVCGKDATNYGLIVKFSLTGELLWIKNYANTDTLGMTTMKLKDQKLYIASAANVSEEKNEKGDLKYQYDACIFVYDLNGEILDKYTFGGSLEDRFNSLLLLDDSIIAIGHTKSKNIAIKGLNYQKDMTEAMIIKYDYEGNILDKKVYSGKQNETLSDIIEAIPMTEDLVNNTKNYIMVGYTNSQRKVFLGNNKDYFARVLKYNNKLEILEEK